MANTLTARSRQAKARAMALRIIFTILLGGLAFTMIIPFLWMISASMKHALDVTAIPIKWIPDYFYPNNYKEVWNIGGNGQALIGALSTTAIMFYFGGKIPNGLLWAFMLVASLVSGMIWAVLPAIFKAKWNTNETLFTLMMNYIAVQAVEACITVWAPNGSGKLQPMNAYALPQIENKWFLSILVVVLVTVLMFVYLKFSKHGYEISVVGESRNTALYIGINVKKVIIRTMLLSGAICGLVGFLIVGGVDCTISPTDTIGSIGFTAILVSWMAKFNPLLMVLTSALVSFLEVGTTQVATGFKIDGSISDIVTAIVLLFVVGSEFFVNYKIMFRHSSKEVSDRGYH